jgi:hypothetical protein
VNPSHTQSLDEVRNLETVRVGMIEGVA